MGRKSIEKQKELFPREALKMHRRTPILTILEPWASLIATGEKTIETRTHSRFKGLQGKTIAIHAAAPRGEIIALAHVAEARWLAQKDSKAACCNAKGLFGLVFDEVVEIDPIPAKGKQGIWYHLISHKIP